MIESSSRVCQNVMVKNLSVGHSHGLCIGSWTNGGVRNITFQDIIVDGDDHLDTGPCIKSAKQRGSKDSCLTRLTFFNFLIFLRFQEHHSSRNPFNMQKNCKFIKNKKYFFRSFA